MREHSAPGNNLSPRVYVHAVFLQQVFRRKGSEVPAWKLWHVWESCQVWMDPEQYAILDAKMKANDPPCNPEAFDGDCGGSSVEVEVETVDVEVGRPGNRAGRVLGAATSRAGGVSNMPNTETSKGAVLQPQRTSTRERRPTQRL